MGFKIKPIVYKMINPVFFVMKTKDTESLDLPQELSICWPIGKNCMKFLVYALKGRVLLAINNLENHY